MIAKARESCYSNKRREARVSATHRLVGGKARGASRVRYRSPSMASSVRSRDDLGKAKLSPEGSVEWGS